MRLKIAFALLALVLITPTFARRIIDDSGGGGGCTNLTWETAGLPAPNPNPPGTDPPWHVELWLQQVQATCNELQLDLWISSVTMLDGEPVSPSIAFGMMWNDTDFFGKPGSFVLDPDDVPIYVCCWGGSRIEHDGMHVSGGSSGIPWTGDPHRLARFTVRRDDTNPGCTKTQMFRYTGHTLTHFVGEGFEANEVLFEGRIRNDGGSGPAGCTEAPS